MISLNDYENILYISPILKLKSDFSNEFENESYYCNHFPKNFYTFYVKIKIRFLRRRWHRIIVSFSNHFPKKLLYIRCIEIKMKISGRRWQYRLLFFQRFLSIVERKILYRTTIANTALNTNRKTRDLWFWILDISSFVDNEAGIISRKIGASWRKREVWGKGKDDFSLADENRWRHRWPWC